MLQALLLPVIPTVHPSWPVAPKGKMFTNSHIFSKVWRIFEIIAKITEHATQMRRGKKKFCQHLLTHATAREININHYWKGIQHHLPFTSYRHCQKLSGNTWLPISLFLPIQEKQGHAGLQTLWNFFDLLGCFAAHCPAVGNHGGTGLVIGTLFSQVPWEKKRCVKPTEDREDRKIKSLLPRNIFLRS